jgi:hypothetical protein
MVKRGRRDEQIGLGVRMTGFPAFLNQQPTLE